MNRFKLAAMATLLLAALATSCDKPGGATPDPDPTDPNEVTMADATALLYYGDRQTESLYNYFVGLSTTVIEEDEDGYPVSSNGGYMVKLDLYSSVASESWETAVLPDGKYKLQGKGEELSSGMLHNYYTRLEQVVNGEVKSTDFTSGEVEVSNKNGVTTVKGKFVTTGGDEIVFSYEGILSTEDPDESETLPPLTEPVNVTMSLAAGAYYGNDYQLGADRYEILLTNAPVNGEGEISGEGYMLDLSLFDNPATYFISPADGTYIVADTYEAGTVEPGEIFFGVIGSYIAKFDSNGNNVGFSLITSGSITIGTTTNGYSVKADLTTEEGISVKAAYEGDIYFDDLSDNNGGDEGETTTLTGDVTFDFAADAEIEVAYCGDYYENNTDNWIIFIEDDSNGISVELNTTYTGFSTNIPFPEKGQYNMAVENGVGMLPGTIDEYGYLIGTYYYVPSGEDGVSDYATAVDGNIKYSKDGELDVLEIGIVDANYNLVTATWKGTLPDAIDVTEELSLSATKSAAKAHAAKKTLVKKETGVKKTSVKNAAASIKKGNSLKNRIK